MFLHMKSFECLGDTFLLIHLLLQDKLGSKISDPKKKNVTQGEGSRKGAQKVTRNI